jgi:hypothetical protein
MRLFASGLRKLVRRPASWVTLGLTVGLLFLIYIAVGASLSSIPEGEGRAETALLLTFPTAYPLIIAFILSLGGLLAVLYGAAIAGSEWSWGTLKAAVARGEGRTWYIVMSFAAIAVVLAIGLLVAFVFGIGAAALGATLAGIPLDGAGDADAIGKIPERLGRGILALVEQGAIGFAIATIARSQLAGIGVGIGVFFAEQFATFFLPDVVQYLPFHVANAVISGAEAGLEDGPQPGQIDDPTVVLALVLAWLFGSIVVAALVTERAEISG